MKLSLIAALLPMVVASHVAVAQSMVIPTPSVSTTSPLDISSGTQVGGTGIPLGATEIISAGTSPAPINPTGTIAIPGSGMPCATLGTSSVSMFGSSATYDGGGMTPGSSMPATGISAGST